MMGPIQEYLQDILNVMEEEKFFETTPISRKVMVDCLLKAMDRNLDTKGDFHLTEQDMIDVYEAAVNAHVSDAIAECLQNGFIEITGVDPNGELIYGLTDSGQKEIGSDPDGHMVTAKFEQIGPFGPFSLN